MRWAQYNDIGNNNNSSSSSLPSPVRRPTKRSLLFSYVFAAIVKSTNGRNGKYTHHSGISYIIIYRYYTIIVVRIRHTVYIRDVSWGTRALPIAPPSTNTGRRKSGIIYFSIVLYRHAAAAPRKQVLEAIGIHISHAGGRVDGRIPLYALGRTGIFAHA